MTPRKREDSKWFDPFRDDYLEGYNRLEDIWKKWATPFCDACHQRTNKKQTSTRVVNHGLLL